MKRYQVTLLSLFALTLLAISPFITTRLVLLALLGFYVTIRVVINKEPRSQSSVNKSYSP